MNKEKFKEVQTKSKRAIITDNFLGGIAWGVGTVIGATVVIGLLGLIIAGTKSVPFVGEITKIVIEQIEMGRLEFKNNN